MPSQTKESDFGVETVVARAREVAAAKIARAKEIARQQATVWESQLNEGR